MSAPRHSYRYPDDRYSIARARAEQEGTTVSAIVAERLDQYIDGWQIKVDEPVTVATYTENEWNAAMAGAAEINPVAAEVLGERTDVTIHDDAPPACTALIGTEAKTCPCAGFEKQKQSENRCGQCGHLKGLHQ